MSKEFIPRKLLGVAPPEVAAPHDGVTLNSVQDNYSTRQSMRIQLKNALF